MPRALEDVFARLRCLAESEGWEWRVSVSCLEVYNECLFDLLAVPDPALAASKDMRTRDRLRAGEVPRQALKFTNLGTHTPILVHDLTTQGVGSADEALGVLMPALASRRTGSTNMNAQSSRSHAVVTLHVSGSRTVVVGADENAAAAAAGSSSSAAATGTVTYTRDAVLDIVDLAGSERVRATGASGDTLKEAGQINKSLHTLTKVVQELLQKQQQGARGGGGGSISWRNSTLTQLLQRSLGGNSRTVIIATISPAVVNWPESCNTLLFAAQARSLTTQYTQNETVSTAAAGAAGGAGGVGSGAVLLSAVERAREVEHSRRVAELSAQLAVMKRALGLAGMTLGGGAAADGDDSTTVAYDADGLVAQLAASASAGETVMRLACDACEAIDSAASQVSAAAAVACPPCPVDPASLPSPPSSSSSSAAAPSLASAVSALAKDAVSARLAAVQLQGYQLRCEAAEAQLALQQPVVQRYFATGVLDGAAADGGGADRGSKRMRVSIEGASADAPGSARPVSGAKRRRGGGAAAAAAAPESSTAEALASSAIMSSSSSAVAAPSASQLDAARAEGVAEGLARASAEFVTTTQALTALVSALATHVAAVTDHAAAVQEAASQAAQPLLAARKAASAVASTLLAAIGAGGDARAFSAVLRAAADALTSERAASAAATASLATALPRLAEQQSKLEELGAAVAALTAENEGLAATLRSAQEVGMEAVAEAARAREEAKKAAASGQPAPAAAGYRAVPGGAAAHLSRLSSISGVSSAHSGGVGVDGGSASAAPAGFEDVNLLDGSVDRAPEDVPAGAAAMGDTAYSAASSTGASGAHPLHRTGSSVTECTSISSFSMGSGGTAAAAAARVRHQPDSAFAKAFAGVKAPPVAVPPVALSALAAASSAEAAAPAYSVSGGASASGHNDSMGSLGSGVSAAGSGTGAGAAGSAMDADDDDDDTGSLRGEDLELISDPITREGDPVVQPAVAVPAAAPVEPPKPAAKKPAGPGLRALFGLNK